MHFLSDYYVIYFRLVDFWNQFSVKGFDSAVILLSLKFVVLSAQGSKFMHHKVQHINIGIH